jgi:hypothetical protein
VDARDDSRRRVEGVEGGPLGAGVFLGRQQVLQLFTQGLPRRVLVAATDRVGKDREGNGPETCKACERLCLLGRCGSLFVLNPLEGTDGSEDVAGLCFFAACDGSP